MKKYTVKITDFRCDYEKEEVTVSVSLARIKEAMEMDWASQALEHVGLPYIGDSDGETAEFVGEPLQSYWADFGDFEPEPNVEPDLVGNPLCDGDFPEGSIIEGTITNQMNGEDDSPEVTVRWDNPKIWTIEVDVEDDEIVSQKIL